MADTPGMDDSTRAHAALPEDHDAPEYVHAAGAFTAAETVVYEDGPSPSSALPAALPASLARAWASLVALSLAAFLMVTNEIAPLGLISRITEDLDRSPSQVGLLTTAFALMVMLGSIPVARLTTTWSRRTVVLTSLAVWTAGTTVVVLSQGFGQLLVGRGLTGIAHALFWAVVAPAVAGMFPPEIRGKCVARLLLGASGAGVVGLPAATWLAQQTTWKAPFLILAVGGAVAFVIVAVVMPSFRSEQGTAARGQYPDKRRFIRVLAVTLLTTASMATTFTYITPVLVDTAGFAESTVPLLLATAGAVGVVSMYVVGKFLDVHPVRSIAVGLALLLVMWLGLALLGSIQPVVVAMLVLQGLGWSVLVAAMINWAIRHTPWATDLGVAAYNSTFNAGNVVGSLLGAGLLAWLSAAWLPAASAALVAISSVLVWQVRPGRNGRASAETPQTPARAM